MDAEGLTRNTVVMPTGEIIRPIEPLDNRSVAAIIRDVMTEHGAVGEGYSIGDAEVDNMYRAYQFDQRAAYFVVEAEAEVVGGAGIGPLAGSDPNTCELKKMYFRPSLRGRGVAGPLLEICLGAARELGYRSCYLETLSSMDAARRVYESHGFVPVDKPVGNTGHFKCNHFMVRNL